MRLIGTAEFVPPSKKNGRSFRYAQDDKPFGFNANLSFHPKLAAARSAAQDDICSGGSMGDPTQANIGLEWGTRHRLHLCPAP